MSNFTKKQSFRNHIRAWIKNQNQLKIILKTYRKNEESGNLILIQKKILDKIQLVGYQFNSTILTDSQDFVRFFYRKKSYISSFQLYLPNQLSIKNLDKFSHQKVDNKTDIFNSEVILNRKNYYFSISIEKYSNYGYIPRKDYFNILQKVDPNFESKLKSLSFKNLSLGEWKFILQGWKIKAEELMKEDDGK